MTSIQADGTVEFRFFRPAVGQVQLVGDFSQWTGRALAMRNLGDGWWTAEVKLAPGEYRFRYIADGNWYTDFASHGVEKSKLGWNSVLVVRRRPEYMRLQEAEALAGVRAVAA